MQYTCVNLEAAVCSQITFVDLQTGKNEDRPLVSIISLSKNNILYINSNFYSDWTGNVKTGKENMCKHPQKASCTCATSHKKTKTKEENNKEEK